jgi:hypothetical protein
MEEAVVRMRLYAISTSRKIEM